MLYVYDFVYCIAIAKGHSCITESSTEAYC